MIRWTYRVSWDDGRTQDVTIRLGDKARFESKMGKAVWRIIQAGEWTDYCDLLIVYTALSRMKVQPEQSFDEFLDTVDLEQLEFGEPEGKASGQEANTGPLPSLPSSGV